MQKCSNPLIVLEGIDGAGKHTHSALLVEWLNLIGKTANLVSFPFYESLSGIRIRDQLQGKWAVFDASTDGQSLPEINEPLNAFVLQSLMAINRYEMAETLLRLKRDGPVVCDRYWPSGFVYGRAKGIPEGFLEAIHSSLPRMDMCIFVDIPVEESFARRPKRRDLHEMDAQFLKRVREDYLYLFMDKGWCVVDGCGSVKEVQERIRREIRWLFPPEVFKDESGY